MNWQAWQQTAMLLWRRLFIHVLPSGLHILIAVLIAMICVAVAPLWRIFRSAVTLVHELGHAVVALIFRRKWRSLVVNPDMSGEVATLGAASGFGRIATTAAGYPSPAIVGSALIWAAVTGRAALLFPIAVVVLICALIRARSFFTVIVVLFALGLNGAAWRWLDPRFVGACVCGLGIGLLLGAWRQLTNVARSRDVTQDPAVLGHISVFPRGIWIGLFGIVIMAASCWAGLMLWPMILSGLKLLK